MKGRSISAETKVLINEAHKSKYHSAETKSLIKLTLSSQNHYNFGKTHSIEIIYKMSKAKISKYHFAETKALMSLTKNKKIFVYLFDSVTKKNFLYKSIFSCIEAAKFLDYSTRSL
jgi:hypothetical protein